MIDRFKLFGNKSDDIKSIIAFGSAALTSSDKYSDLDLIIFTSDPLKYINDADLEWVDELGEVISRLVVKDIVAHMKVNKLIMKDGPALDLLIVDVKEFTQVKNYLAETPLQLPENLIRLINNHIYDFHYYLKRGYQIVFDTIDIQEIINLVFKHEAGSEDKDMILNEERFNGLWNQFWQNCYKMNTWLIGNELAYANIMVDNILKRNLILLIQWYTLLETNDKNLDVFYYGAKLKQWCDPKLYLALFNVFPNAGEDEVRDAVLQTMQIYIKLSNHIALKKEFNPNRLLEKQVYNAFMEKQLIGTVTDLKEITIPLYKLPEGEDDIDAIFISDNGLCSKDGSLLEIDCFLITTNCYKYTNHDTWRKSFKDNLSLSNAEGAFGVVVNILLKNGCCINVNVINNLHLTKNDNHFQQNFDQILNNGFELIHAKEEILETILHRYQDAPKHFLAGQADAKRFYNNYKRFWHTANKMAAKLMRQDFYYAIVVLDNSMKNQLIKMMEWHAAIHHPVKNIYPQAKKIQQWCDPEFYVGLLRNFPHSDINTMFQSLVGEVELYRKISHELAYTCGFKLNAELENSVLDTILECVYVFEEK
ncbi:streptomycin adenylyltransferase [Pedobacter psychrotolerans]|uniref:Streptomycin adenylyltransferase n=1 Tax=Pedobacter psychrotolerans TaxID=1843235 RepID=A0A4R2HC31_9SPHI|nr:aminoglycoside 6-adenylyltransferase [Pedobacter psychrotolerans]TCO25229.1 streptomycin adenylyltransferase [Pedobacter psychrotolerans]GGE47082.1 hypothetical protein GCM10011413_11500 [Pedobacter psychrotolerans]